MDKLGKALGASVLVSVGRKHGNQVIVLEYGDRKLEIPQLSKRQLRYYNYFCTTSGKIDAGGVLENQASGLELLYCVYLARKNNKDFDSRVAGYTVEPPDKGYAVKMNFYERKKKS